MWHIAADAAIAADAEAAVDTDNLVQLQQRKQM
jgi:hypothetical protein